MPSKGRPAPLSDVIFRAKLEKSPPSPIAAPPGVPEEIPVHNTFIQFGTKEGLGTEKQQQLSTAPAWIGPSVQSMIQSIAEPMSQAPMEGNMPLLANGGTPADGKEFSDFDPNKRLASPKKVPVMRYSLSASSARAAGVPTSNAVVASYEPCGGWLPEDGKALGEALPPWGPAAAVGLHQDPSTTQAGDDDVANDECDDSDDSLAAEAARLVQLGEIPSLGSIKHEEGMCKRCCFFPKGRCQNGTNCEFCHFDHDKRKRKKKKKKKSAPNQEGGGSDSDSDDGDGVEKADKDENFNVAYAAAAVALEEPLLEQIKCDPSVWCATPPSRGGISCGQPAPSLAPLLPDAPDVGRATPVALPLVDPPPRPPSRGLPTLGEQPSPLHTLGITHLDSGAGGSSQVASPTQASWEHERAEADLYYAYGRPPPTALPYDRYGYLGAMPPGVPPGVNDRMSSYSPYAGAAGYHQAGLPHQHAGVPQHHQQVQAPNMAGPFATTPVQARPAPR
uniref:C3H1-type domain-containing protein n=1 Tax=Zooxanthella nutricula TaxID=1333877 RepID=A0A6V0FHP7_9DINO|mmetsp:Transcript_68907/g.211364  ORF Transcript_68907/g.211364 Transcript_68907/m.211364 type:complete len:504 (+) Transcript_68907:61-1572(+)